MMRNYYHRQMVMLVSWSIGVVAVVAVFAVWFTRIGAA